MSRKTKSKLITSLLEILLFVCILWDAVVVLHPFICLYFFYYYSAAFNYDIGFLQRRYRGYGF